MLDPLQHNLSGIPKLRLYRGIEPQRLSADLNRKGAKNAKTSQK
jgi:hypothetical protein